MQGEVRLYGFNKSSGKCACQSTELWALPGAPGAASLVFATALWPSDLRGAAAARRDGMFHSASN